MKGCWFCHELGRDLTNTELCLFHEGYADAEAHRESAASLIQVCEDGEMREGWKAYSIGYARATYDVLS